MQLLKGCPFCGGAVSINYSSRSNLHPDGIVCGDCACYFRFYELESAGRLERESEIAERWNMRFRDMKNTN